MVRINVEIPDELRKELKAKLALEGKTIKEWVLEQIEGYLGGGKRKSKAAKPRAKTSKKKSTRR
ncbi:MAG: hypothetical protein RL885_29030 [Planctomycetota bacterium]